MEDFIKGNDTLAEVRKGIKQYGSFYGSLRGWEHITVSSDRLVIDTNDTRVTYKNVHGIFGFPTTLS